MNKKFVFLILGISILITGCIESKIVYEKGNVVAVYYHENNRYSVLIQEDDEIRSIGFPSYYYVYPIIFADVKEGEPMWYEIKYRTDGISGITDYENNYLHIHIHSHKDLRDGSWNHGKFGTGGTKRIAVE